MEDFHKEKYYPIHIEFDNRIYAGLYAGRPCKYLSYYYVISNASWCQWSGHTSKDTGCIRPEQKDFYWDEMINKEC